MNIVHKVSGRYTLLSLEISHEVGRGRRSHKIHKSYQLFKTNFKTVSRYTCTVLYHYLLAKSNIAPVKRNGCHNKLHCCISSWGINKHLF